MVTYTVHHEDEEYHFTYKDVIESTWDREIYGWIVRLNTGTTLKVSSVLCNSISKQKYKKSKRFRIRAYLFDKDMRRFSIVYKTYDGLRNLYINVWFLQIVIGEKRKRDKNE